MKNLFVAGAMAAAFVFVGCSSADFTDFVAREAKTSEIAYDITVVSGEDFPSKVYKLVDKNDGEVYYALTPTDEDELKEWEGAKGIAAALFVDKSAVNANVLPGCIVISEENAQQIVAFIEKIEIVWSSEKRSGSGVFYDFEVYRTRRGSTWVANTRTATATSFGTSSLQAEEQLVQYEYDRTLIRIQLKTVRGRDKLIYAIGDDSIECEPKDLDWLKASLSQ